MEASLALRAIRRGWLLVLMGIAGAMSAGVTLHISADPVYESSARYIVAPVQDPTNPSTLQDGLRTLDDARSRAIIATFTQVLDTPTIHYEASLAAGIDAAALDGYTFRSAILPEANVVELVVRGPLPDATVALSNAVGTAAAARFTDLYPIFRISLLDAPAPPTGSANPTLIQTLATTGALGLLLGGGLALLWGAPRVRRERARHRRLLAYTVTEDPGVVTPLHRPQDRRASGAG
jgi:capsular polysaccharide biosynthesis protein